MARMRMILLFDRSAEHDALVLGTSNKTELLLGLRHPARRPGLRDESAGRSVQDSGPAPGRGTRRSRVDPRPTALRRPVAGPVGREELGFSYDEVDRLLALLVDQRVSRESVIERGFSPEHGRARDHAADRAITVQAIAFPLIAKVSPRSVGWDFRYPRDWLS